MFSTILAYWTNWHRILTGFTGFAGFTWIYWIAPAGLMLTTPGVYALPDWLIMDNNIVERAEKAERGGTRRSRKSGL
jgi:hypothetical protein